MLNQGGSTTVSVIVASAVLLLGACERESSGASRTSRSSEALPAFCSTAPAEAACATTDEVMSYGGDRPLVDSSAWNRTWMLETAGNAQAGQGDTVVAVLFEGEAPAAFDEPFDRSYPVIQQTIVTDPAPGGRAFADLPGDLDDSDGLTKRWIDVGGRKMLHLATRDVDQLQYVERFEGDLAVYVEVTVASGSDRFQTLRMLGESLEPVA